MELRPPKLSPPRRRIDISECRKKERLAKMRIEPNGENSAGHFSFPGNFKLFVNGALWTAWSENPSVILLYILDALDSPRYTARAKLERRPTNHEMTLSEGVFRKGDNYVVDENYEDGAEMLSTKTGESEIAFHVIGRDIKCAGCKFVMIGRPYTHVQYI